MLRSAKHYIELISEEWKFAVIKYPHFNSAHEGWAIIKEELDELWEVVREKQENEGRSERLEKEAIQVAAMALRFLVDRQFFKN